MGRMVGECGLQTGSRDRQEIKTVKAAARDGGRRAASVDQSSCAVAVSDTAEERHNVRPCSGSGAGLAADRDAGQVSLTSPRNRSNPLSVLDSSQICSQ